MPQKPPFLLFDLDHTLWDYDANAADCLERLFSEFGIKNLIQADFGAFFQSFLKANTEVWNLYSKRILHRTQLRTKRFQLIFGDFGLDDSVIPEGFGPAFYSQCPQGKKLMPHAMEVLEALRPHFQMAVVSNGFDDVQRIKVASSGLAPFFSDIITSESFNLRKPFLWGRLPEHFNREAGEFIAIGNDWENDVVGAQQAQMPAIWYNQEGANVPSEARDFTIHNLQELIPKLGLG